MRIRSLSAAAVAVCVTVPLISTHTARAAGSASCTLSSTVYLDPGDSLTPQKGSFTSVHPKTHKTTATLANCVGTIGGRQLDPTRVGNATYSGTYGTAGDIAQAQGGDTCAGGSGVGVFVYSFPVAGGLVSYRNGFSFARPGSVVVAQATLPNAGLFAATLVFQPTKGDCVNSPITEAAVTGELSFLTPIY